MKPLYLPLLLLCCLFMAGLSAQPHTPRAVLGTIGYTGADQQSLQGGGGMLPWSHGVEVGALLPTRAAWAAIGVRTFLIPAYSVINSSGAPGNAQWISAIGQARFSTRGWGAGEKPFFAPVLGVGAGVEKWSSHLTATFPMSLGAEIRLSKALFLTLEGQYRYRLGTSATLNVAGGLAFSVAQPKPKPEARPRPVPSRAVQPVPAAQAARPAGPGDRDGDGIPDAEDKCPDEPGYVHTQGCPITTQNTPTGPPVSPPASPPVVAVTTDPGNTPPTGPSTQVGKRRRNIAKADSTFLESAKTMILFEPNSDKLSPVSFATLDKIADMMTRYPNSTLHVSGHTDNALDADKSLVLSVKRAYNVKYYLVYKKGIKLSRITSDGYGSDLPVADNKTAEGRKKNARVEFDLFNE